MKITAAHLHAEAARLAKRREQIVADLNGTIGAEQAVTAMLARLRAKPSPAAPAPKK